MMPHLLIIEDDKLLVELLQKKFTENGYAVLTAQDANKARELLEQTPIDIILLDLVLPDIDGYTFLSSLKENAVLKTIPVVIISNLGQREEIDKGLKMGAADYIIKSNALPSDIYLRVEKLCPRKVQQ